MIKAIPNAKPLTDAETIKALECCMSKSACKECPVPSDIADKFSCIPYLAENALNLINELKTEYCKLVRYIIEQSPTAEMSIVQLIEDMPQTEIKPKVIAHIDGKKIDITEFVKEV